MMDSAGNDIALAFGVATTPTYILLDSENKNLGRAAGEIGMGGLDALAAIAAGSIEG